MTLFMTFAYIAQQEQILKKCLAEIQIFKEWLLSGFLDGTIDQLTYHKEEYRPGH